MTERRLVFLIGAVQFINVLDFMMVMPMGPDFGKALGIPSSHLGVIGGSYTAAAAIAGIIAASFLDRFDRRKALAVALAGLVVATALGGLAIGLTSLVAARVLAGMFGGPATAVALAIISDNIPPERRGRAMGAVMGSFALASVLGVPLGLELARLGSWRLPFFTVAALGVGVAAAAVTMLPPQTAHLARRGMGTPILAVMQRPVVLLALSASALGVIANFALIPNLSAYLQFNLGYPRDQLGVLYFVGGIVTFGTMRLGGWLTDRYGATMVAIGGSLWFISVLVFGFLVPSAHVPVIVIFVAFMVSASFRIVPMQALSSRVPAPPERAGFMSAQSAVTHLASAAGAILGSQLLAERADKSLVGMETLAWFAIATSIVFPIVLGSVELRVRRARANA
jgi:predicted MFS family arabinose efflux permease